MALTTREKHMLDHLLVKHRDAADGDIARFYELVRGDVSLLTLLYRMVND